MICYKIGDTNAIWLIYLSKSLTYKEEKADIIFVVTFMMEVVFKIKTLIHWLIKKWSYTGLWNVLLCETFCKC